MHTQPSITPTQRQLHDAHKERSIRFQPVNPLLPPPYRLVYERWPRMFNHRTIKGIIEATAAIHGVTYNEIISPRRSQYLVVVRHEAMWNARRDTAFSYPVLGKAFHRDPTTVIHGCRAHEARMNEGSATWAK